MESSDKRAIAVGAPTLVVMYTMVVAFMALSLAVTSTGTARFAVAMGYDAKVGYAVGGIFDLAKALLLMALLALWGRRSLGLAAVFAIAWGGLVTFSWLATHATVSTAIGGIERSGTWKMEVRSNTKAELASVDQQLSALSRPVPPRTAKTVREAMAAERVPPSVWQDSQECKAIQESAHFAKACAQVVQLRRELAAAQEYERLSMRAGELRGRLAEAPMVATSDPLPAAFSATLGRILPLGGTEGLALLLTMVVELMSCCGLAGLSALCKGRDEREPGTPAAGSLLAVVPPSLEAELGISPASRQSPSLQALPRVSLTPVVSRRASFRQPTSREESKTSAAGSSAATVPASLGSEGGISPATQSPSLQALPIPSKTRVASGRASFGEATSREASESPSNILPMRPRSPSTTHLQGASLTSRRIPEIEIGSHVPAFVRERLETSNGSSLSADELRAAYEAWCAMHSHKPLSLPKFAAELKALGYGKWKSNGRIRYRDLRFAA